LSADAATQFLFFAGKGGVGKTTCAAAAALRAAEAGRAGQRVLVVSTDPAHSLGDALGRELGPRPRRVPTRRGALLAAELDADAALERWLRGRRAALGGALERGTFLDRGDAAALLELALPGADELVGLLELRRLAAAARCRRVVVDTAPTGHTLRLLQMPGALRRLALALDTLQEKHRVLAERLGAGWRPDEVDRAIWTLEHDGRELERLLADASRSTVVLVLSPEELAVAESVDALAALRRLGLAVREALVNRVAPAELARCPTCRARVRSERRAIAHARRLLAPVPLRLLSEAAGEPRGLAALRRLARRPAARGGGAPAPAAAARAGQARRPPDWAAGARLVVFGGKGGVGKTTCAAASALRLARSRDRRRVLLLSVDPAPSLADVLGIAVGDRARRVPGGPPGLRVRELDAAGRYAERRRRYREAVEEAFDHLSGASNFDAAVDRRALAALFEIAPPGIDELLGVLAVEEALAGGEERVDLVVLDAAPTGHLLRLLAMPELATAWVHALLRILLEYRAASALDPLARELLDLAAALRRLAALLRDPARARVAVVSRGGELERRETERLLAALAERRIAVGALVVNAASAGGCALCAPRRRREEATLRSLGRGQRGGCAMILAPAVHPPPRGVRRLEAWARRWQEASA
jgi:arsenite-transporting ATPase